MGIAAWVGRREGGGGGGSRRVTNQADCQVEEGGDEDADSGGLLQLLGLVRAL